MRQRCLQRSCSAGDAEKGILYRGTCEYGDACFDFQCDVVSVVADEDGTFDKPSEVVCLGHGEVSGDRTGNLAETSAGNFSARYIWMVNRVVQPALPLPVPFPLLLAPGVVAGLLVSPPQATANPMKATVSVELSSFFIVFSSSKFWCRF